MGWDMDREIFHQLLSWAAQVQLIKDSFFCHYLPFACHVALAWSIGWWPCTWQGAWNSITVALFNLGHSVTLFPSYFRTWFKLASHAVTNTWAEKSRVQVSGLSASMRSPGTGEKTEASILSMILSVCVHVCLYTHENIPLPPLQVWFKCWNLVTLSLGARSNTFIT